MVGHGKGGEAAMGRGMVVLRIGGMMDIGKKGIACQSKLAPVGLEELDVHDRHGVWLQADEKSDWGPAKTAFELGFWDLTGSARFNCMLAKKLLLSTIFKSIYYKRLQYRMATIPPHTSQF